MINLYDKPTNAAVTITAKVSVLVVPVDLILLKNGATTLEAVTFTSLSVAGLSKFVFTPLSTGDYTLYGDGQVLATVEVVSRPLRSFLQNIEDESTGSWTWDKTTGVMHMVRRDGSALGTFNIVDTLTSSSRELVS